MSVEQFKKSYKDGNIKALRKYITSDKVLSTDKFINYLEESFTTNRDIYNILVLILFNKYDFNKVILILIVRENIEVLENVLSTDIPKHNRPVLNKKLISVAAAYNSISMAKAIDEYIYGLGNSPYGLLADVKSGNTYNIIMGLLTKSDFKFDPDKNVNSIDSFVLALYKGKFENSEKMIPYKDAERIMPNISQLDFWDNFTIKFAVDHYVPVKFLRKILLNNTVDPGVDDNWALKNALNNEEYEIAKELLKHPLVAIEHIDKHFIEHIIRYNDSCVAKRILQSENIQVISFFKKYTDYIIKCDNDVTYLSIKLGIITGTVSDKKYLDNLKIDKQYSMLPYELNLDPEQICKLAFKEDNVELAKSIKNYRISIQLDILLRFLLKYKNTDVYDYVLNNKLKQYYPTYLIIHVGYTIDVDSNKSFVKSIFNIVNDNPDMNYEIAYTDCGNRPLRLYILNIIKSTYSKKNYEKFCLKHNIT